MGTPATKFFLTIEFDKLWIKYRGTHGGDVSKAVTSAKAFEDFFVSKAHEAKVGLGGLVIMASSTLDFPEEFTSKPETIALARAIRGY